jgi:hypothetical protein
MGGHAAVGMSVQERGTIWQRLRSPAGFTSASYVFVMDWAAVYKDIFGGLLIAGESPGGENDHAGHSHVTKSRG